MKPQHKQVRTLVKFNTGTQVHKSKKGKGSYNRKNIKEEK